MKFIKCKTKLDLYNALYNHGSNNNIYYYIGKPNKPTDSLFVWRTYLFYSRNIPLSDLSLKYLCDNWDKYKPYCIAIVDKVDSNIIINLDVNYNVKHLGEWAINYYNNVFVSNSKFNSPTIFEFEPCAPSTGRLNKVLWLYSQYLIQQFVKTTCYDLCLATEELHNPKRTVQDVFTINPDDNDNVIEFWKKKPKVTYNDIAFLVDKFNIKHRPFYDTIINNEIIIANHNCDKSYTFVCPTIKQIINNKMFNTKQKHDIEKAYLYYKDYKNTGISYKLLCEYYHKKYINKDILQDLCTKHNIDITKKPKDVVTAIQHLSWIASMIKQQKIDYIESCIAESNKNYEKAIILLNEKCKNASEYDKLNHKVIIVYYNKYTAQKGSKGFWSVSFVSNKL